MKNFWIAGSFWTIATPAISLLALGLSVYQLILRFIDNKRHLVLGVLDISVITDYICVRYWMCNNSANPINIINIKVDYDGKLSDSTYVPIFAIDNPLLKGKAIYGESTDKLPINIAPYGSHGGYIALPLCQNNTAPTQIKLEITTSNGAPITANFRKGDVICIKRKAKLLDVDKSQLR